MPTTTREVRLATTPRGLPVPGDLAVVETPLPSPGPGQLLVRNRHFLVFAGLRTLLGGAAKDTPVPGLHPGDTLYGPALGEVVHAPDASPLRPGDLVTHPLGWREYALVPAAQCAPVDPAFPDPVAHLSSGATAYGALTRLTGVHPNDTVLVTGAAGGVGSLAGQLARLLGAGRVIGTTGSAWKAERLVTELGYDAVVTGDSWRGSGERGAGYDAGAAGDSRRGNSAERHGEFAARLREVAPDGVDVVVDTVGGAQLAGALEVARRGARFALVGALAGQLAEEGGGGSAPVEIDGFGIVLKGLSIRGYLGADHPDVEAEWTERFAAWLRSGEIRFPLTVTSGIDQAPQALRKLIEGRQFGTAVVELTR
ncbi:MDR family NADP-dependent oxidoreductase [Streptomyces sp. 4F14]|uniref:MDR family NADP-dependent oxidoreductase n=1 Tax=Streptomyces sp. 4F14 TaxID=3394380 RepID=UPI003A89C88C